MTNSVESVECFLRNFASRQTTGETESASTLATLKAQAVAAQDEALAKNLWCLEETLNAQRIYVAAFESIKRGKFYEGWCELERAEITLKYLRRHFAGRFEEFGLRFIDEHIDAKLRQLAILPSEPAPDHIFLRRVYTDLIGRLPSVEEAREFLSADGSDSRTDEERVQRRRELAACVIHEQIDLPEVLEDCGDGFAHAILFANVAGIALHLAAGTCNLV